MADSLGTENGLRYRGYFYDRETQLYYLQSRYYDPEVGRFINADEPEILKLAEESDYLLGTNLFAYCMNNPVNYVDPTGEWLARVISGVVGAAVFGTLANLVVRVVGLFTPISRSQRIAVTAAFAALGGTVGAVLGPGFMAKHTPKLLNAIKNIQKRRFTVSAFGPNRGGNIFGIVISNTLVIMLHMPHPSHRPYFHIQVAVKYAKRQRNIAWIRISPNLPKWRWHR